MEGQNGMADMREQRKMHKLAGSLLLNGAGILAAFGVAFGGLFLVQASLAREADVLLRSGGMVEVPVQQESMTSWEAGQVEVVPDQLTQEELKLAVEKLERETEACPHEPWPGQLTLVEAIECGREWTESFLLPHLGMEDYLLPEYSANCYLWAWQSDVEAGEENPVFSYWNVWMSVRGLEIDLTLNAVTGQVLRVVLTAGGQVPVEYQGKDKLAALLADYADSFGLGGHYRILDGTDIMASGWQMQQSVGEGIYASVETSSVAIAVSSADGLYSGESTEIFQLDLRLQTE